MGILLFLCLTVIFIFAQRKLYGRYIFKKLEIERRFSAAGIFPGESAEFEMTMVNRKLLPVTWLRMEQWMPAILRIDSGGSFVSGNNIKYEFDNILSIAPFQKITRKYRVTGTKRGYFEFPEGIRLLSTDLFGSIQVESEIYPPLHIAVYPELMDARECLLPVRSLQGDSPVDRWIIEDPLMVVGTRDYTGTESIRNINWKASARHVTVQARVYEHTADRKLLLLLYLPGSIRTNSELEGETIEAAISATASVAVLLVGEGVQVGFATNASCASNPENLVIPPGCTDDHLENLLTAFSAVTSYCYTDFGGLYEKVSQELPGDTELIVFSPFMDKAMEEGLEEMMERNVSVILMKPPGNMRIPTDFDVFCFREGMVPDEVF